MKLVVFAVAALSGVSACTPYQGALPPSQWDPRFKAAFDANPIGAKCDWMRQLRANGVSLSPEDKAILNASLRQSGMTAPETVFAYQTDQTLKTGMSYHEVQCIGGYLINDAFYSGVGHQWQMQLGSDYVYLVGNGTETGMRVTGWN